MMGNFEDVRAWDASGEIGFRFAFDVAGQKNCLTRETRAQHDRAVVLRRSLERSRSQKRAKVHGAEHLHVAIAHETDWNELRSGGIEQTLRTIARKSAR